MDKIFYAQQVKQAFLPLKEGGLTVLPQHNYMIASIEKGVVDCLTEHKEKKFFFIHQAISHITPDKTTLLAQNIHLLPDLNKINDRAFLDEKLWSEEEKDIINKYIKAL